MKRIILLAVCLAVGAITAQAQKIPLYSEVFDERTDKLSSKEWRSAEGHLRQEIPQADGTTSVTIYRADSLKFYTLAERTKTVAEIPFSQLKTPGQALGVVKDASSARELTGREVVEGYDCAVYKVTKSTTNASGQTTSTYHTEWYYEPLDLVIRYVESLNALNRITRNVVQGPQSAHLFTIPRDYKWMDAGAAMNEAKGTLDALQQLMGGKAPAGSSPEQQQNVQDALKKMQEAFGNANRK